MRWIIELLNPGDITLANAVKAAGHELIPIHLERDVPATRLPEGEMVFHGSIQKAEEILLDRPDLQKYVWYDKVAFAYSNYTPLIQHLLLNQPISVSLERLKQDKWEVYQKLAVDTKIFVRPDAGNKTFTGRLLDLQDFDKFWANKAMSTAKDTDIIQVSKPQEILGEWRFIVDSREEILAVSSYIYQGNRTEIPSAPTGATKLCKLAVATGLKLGPMFTIDIAQTKAGSFGILECNAFSTADLYACKVERIISRAEEILA